MKAWFSIVLLAFLPVTLRAYTPEAIYFLPLAGETGSILHSAFITSSGDTIVTAKVRKTAKGYRPQQLAYYYPAANSYAFVDFFQDGRVRAIRMPGGNIATFSYKLPRDKTSPDSIVSVKVRARGPKRQKAVIDQTFNWLEYKAALDELITALQNTPDSPRRRSGLAGRTDTEEQLLSSIQLMLKVGGITTGIIAGGLGAATGNIPVAVLGFAGAAAGIADLVNRSSTVENINTVLSEYDRYELGKAIFNMRKNGASWRTILKTRTNSVGFYGVLFGIGDELIGYAILEGRMGRINVKSQSVVITFDYTWTSNSRDLDTATEFLGKKVGYAANSSAPFMSWTGDDTSSGGGEIARIFASEAALAGAMPQVAYIKCYAGWYTPAGGSGPATLSIEAQGDSIDGAQLTKSISPGSQSGVASKEVGRVKLSFDSKTQMLTYLIE